MLHTKHYFECAKAVDTLSRKTAKPEGMPDYPKMYVDDIGNGLFEPRCPSETLELFTLTILPYCKYRENLVLLV